MRRYEMDPEELAHLHILQKYKNKNSAKMPQSSKIIVKQVML